MSATDAIDLTFFILNRDFDHEYRKRYTCLQELVPLKQKDFLLILSFLVCRCGRQAHWGYVFPCQCNRSVQCNEAHYCRSVEDVIGYNCCCGCADPNKDPRSFRKQLLARRKFEQTFGIQTLRLG